MKPDFVYIKKKKVAYYIRGNKHNEAIVLLHGWPETSKIWDKVALELSENYYTVAIDLPGLGDSDGIGNHNTEHVASFVYEIVDALHIKTFHLLSHDIGSWVAVTYGLRYEQTLKSLTLIDAGIPGLLPESYFGMDNAEKAWHFYFHAIEALPELLLKGKEQEYLEWFFTHKSFIKTAITAQDIQYYCEKYKGNFTGGFDYYRQYQISAEINNSLLHKLHVPVLAIGGQYAVSDKMMAVAHALSDNGLCEVIADCGHYVPEEQPQSLLVVFKKFLKLNDEHHDNDQMD